MAIERLTQWLTEINAIGALESGGAERLAYTYKETAAIELIRKWCEQEGLTCREDAAGNLICRREGRQAGAAVAFGSHVDTVYDGGRYDGTLGVIAGLEVIRRLNERNETTEAPLELIVFRAEESSRFGMATIGSKLMAGAALPEHLAALTDRDGITFESAVTDAGYAFERLHKAARLPEELKAFFELHIEQGSVLEEHCEAVGLVDAIAAPERLRVTLEGKASHSGTTPMDMRRDALAGASELVLFIEEAARDEKRFRSVATVGKIDIKPGAMNTVPGKTVLDIDIRGTNTASRGRIAESVRAYTKQLADKRGLQAAVETLAEEEPTALNTDLQRSLADACGQLRIPGRVMMSGAGHDVMNMAKRWPSALIFVPSTDGLSHHPEEYTPMHEFLDGVNVLERTVIAWANTAVQPEKEVSS
ncbi:Zn-dependent hydrolase [Salisediminibacterium halotolerans]|uniref:Zn-dependent hydrolase n=1 Tax=Salisediminibacterium halotolerans TaxID=517425 RepID=UPI000F0F0964|nr:Zn-dependent hydrolase [Salisediminibacterium halotolerans]RLJ75755.1 N-carbamoyl-L-amino-acid hydrolase [Actinophytocola xinjiangensis]RPE89609.1 N-carbamoyl-L-amino-acid hydrolase [Salisediminibacterium halotolerans]TWG36368.1 N-carbamoyl-L-amino-acid hydrolase [Salisediminibacterium halotolerans]GEL08894.1 putative hydrolase [Salisediminibacterium halotolerans]